MQGAAPRARDAPARRRQVGAARSGSSLHARDVAFGADIGLVAGRVGSFLRLLAGDEEPLSVDLAEAVRAELEWIWLAGPAVRHRFSGVAWFLVSEASYVPGNKMTD